MRTQKLHTTSSTPLQKLKKVSGRLRELLRGREKARVEPNRVPLLVVEDEDSIRFSLTEYFSSHGFKVDTARDLKEAETQVRVQEYNVIIQDLRLGHEPLASGIELIRKSRKWNPNTRIVVLTSDFSADIEAKARIAGADAILSKPKPLSEVAQVVQGLIDAPRSRGISD